MPGVRMGLCAAVAALLGTTLAMSPGPVAAAPAGHYSFSSLGADAMLVRSDGDLMTQSTVWVNLLDPATGDAQLNFGQDVYRVGADGSFTWLTNAYGSVVLSPEVDNRLESAHAAGVITIYECTVDPDWGFCQSTREYEASIDATWTANSPMMKTRWMQIASITRTSRFLMKASTDYRWADAQVLLDGQSLGASVPESRIYDSRRSEVDIYFGSGDLPGVQMTAATAASLANPAGNSNSKTGYDIEDAQAVWYGSNGMSAYFMAESLSTSPRQADRQVDAVFNASILGTDIWGNQGLREVLDLTGTGQFEIDRQLTSATFSGSLQGQDCTADVFGSWVCLDVTDLPVEMSFTGTGPLSWNMTHASGPDPAGWAPGHSRGGSRNADFVGSVNGQPLPAPDYAYLESLDWRGTPAG